MLPTTNRIISVYRFSETSGKRSFSLSLSGLRVYIQSRDDLIVPGLDNIGAYKLFTMMTNGVPDIRIDDKIKDEENNVYYVRGAEKHKDLTGQHSYFTMTNKND